MPPQVWHLVAHNADMQGVPLNPQRKGGTMRRRNRHVSVWMNDKEYAKLKRKANAAGLGLDPFIRKLVAGTEIKPKPPEEYAKLLRELSAIGNNINQIAYWSNYRKGIYDAEIKEAAALARQAFDLVKQCL